MPRRQRGTQFPRSDNPDTLNLMETLRAAESGHLKHRSGAAAAPRTPSRNSWQNLLEPFAHADWNRRHASGATRRIAGPANRRSARREEVGGDRGRAGRRRP
ncbi:hypothetical protein FRAHR75_200059 [Frankia sp. Hr75.2]|nr:hypothetical protein FRAHR75_200059 [Frankia sp. Hr75.2]SQE00359.1 hypothetical protein FMEAI12_6500045 [Parafrankia sp. Ea1.12]